VEIVTEPNFLRGVPDSNTPARSGCPSEWEDFIRGNMSSYDDIRNERRLRTLRCG
jgi:hypothetical protein